MSGNGCTDTLEVRAILSIMQAHPFIVTGVYGQDGAYLVRLLLQQGHSVIGIGRPTGTPDDWRLRKLGIDKNPRLKFASVNLSNPSDVLELINDVRPQAIFHLASNSFIGSNPQLPNSRAMVGADSVINILEAISKVSRETKFFQAGSSEMFGLAAELPQTESSKFSPRNTYGSSKLVDHFAALDFRERGGVFSSTAILYNHESPLRSEQFVTRKISSSVAKIVHGELRELEIGNLSAIRDWGYAPEYVQGMYRIIEHHNPETFLLSTGRASTVRDFVKLAFAVAGVSIVFQGLGLGEIGINSASGRILVKVNPEFFRPAEETPLVGDASKANALLGWQASTELEKIVQFMVEQDIARVFGKQGY